MNSPTAPPQMALKDRSNSAQGSLSRKRLEILLTI